MSPTGWALLATLLLLALNAFFVAAEFALVGARRTQIEPVAQGGSRRARTTLTAMENVSLMMAGAQLGITICSIGLGALAEPAIASLLLGPLTAIGLPEGLVHPISFVLALTIVVALHVIFGEMVPKNLTLAAPDRAALVLGPALFTLVRFSKPIIVALNGIATLGLRCLGVRAKDAVASSYDVHEVAQLARESHREGMLADAEYGLMTNALSFTKATAADVLVPWSDVVSVSSLVSAQDVQTLAGRTRHLRFPVLDGPGMPVGYLHVKDLLHVPALELESQVPPVLVRSMPSMQADAPLPEVLASMQAANAVMAAVHVADGMPVGILTVADVVAALVDPGHPRSALK